MLELSRFDFTEFGVLEFSGIVRRFFSCVLALIKFDMLVNHFRLGSELLCLSPFLFYSLVDSVTFLFLRTPCRFFSSFVSFF